MATKKKSTRVSIPEKNMRKPTKAPRAPVDQNTPEARNRAIAGLFGNQGTNAANALIGQYLPNGVLGQVDTTLQGGSEAIGQKRDLVDRYANRAPEQTNVMNQMQAGLGGYTSPQYQAQREQMMKGVQSNYATAANQLAKGQARAKVYGVGGLAQQNNLVTGAMNNKNDLDQQLYVKNIDESQKRLNDYGQYGRGLSQEEYARQSDAAKGFGDEASRQRQEQLDREKTNLGQSDAEVSARLGLVQGIGGLALTQAQNKAANALQQKALSKLGR